VAELTPITGELQLQVMSAVWRIGGGTVRDIRAALPSRYRGAYNTIQTVLNRLSDRGLLSRHKVGNAIAYRARMSEDGYLARSVTLMLARASPDARRAAVAWLVSTASDEELDDIQRRRVGLQRT